MVVVIVAIVASCSLYANSVAGAFQRRVECATRRTAWRFCLGCGMLAAGMRRRRRSLDGVVEERWRRDDGCWMAVGWMELSEWWRWTQQEGARVYAGYSTMGHGPLSLTLEWTPARGCAAHKKKGNHAWLYWAPRVAIAIPGVSRVAIRRAGECQRGYQRACQRDLLRWPCCKNVQAHSRPVMWLL